VLPGGSEIVCVTLPRPMGVVFDWDEARRRAVVSGFVEGGNAEQRRKAGRGPGLPAGRIAPPH
jgi:hypothetical protein